LFLFTPIFFVGVKKLNINQQSDRYCLCHTKCYGPRLKFDHAGPENSLLVLRTATVVAASSDNCARLWSVENGTVQREYTGHQKAVTALAFCDQITSVESPSGA
jgi:WD40 repeat protein